MPDKQTELQLLCDVLENLKQEELETERLNEINSIREQCSHSIDDIEIEYETKTAETREKFEAAIKQTKEQFEVALANVNKIMQKQLEHLEYLATRLY
jgi:hypothetical protein